MNNILYILLFLFISNLYFTQTATNLAYLNDGGVKLVDNIEYISLEDNANGLLLIININSKDYTFLVDTGASVSILNNQSFKNANIVERKEKIKIKDPLGNEEEKDLFYLDFKIGENQLSDFAFIKSDLSQLFKNNCSKLDGIIGANVLKKLNWKFVKKENKLFFSQKPFTYEGYNEPTSVKWAGSIPLVEMKVNDYKFLALIDTGHFGTFIFPNYIYINNFGFGTYYNSTKGRGNLVTTINGSQKVELKKARLESLSLGNIDFSEYEVILAPKVLPNIGNGIILQNGFIFNFLTDEIAFAKNEKSTKAEPLRKIKICKSEKNSREIEVCFFWDEPTNKMLKLHDQIISIDSINTADIDAEQYCKVISYVQEAKKPVKLVLKRGKKQFDYILN
ncbi:aspartyl protease family protein [Chryseobacterium sp.]|uniref:aspartyl protease family protein n=1 Tax=Chryseobacterium sp. TaxID=1871047 RepID=UPI0011C81D92|nr:aspartyl protease family protein [Chryseobacterium sp.]TXF76260.1 hypothetical protein FUA25_10270 [Chryseobacterium sp.]